METRFIYAPLALQVREPSTALSVQYDLENALDSKNSKRVVQWTSPYTELEGRNRRQI